jgi:hypothetical protein
MKMNLSSCVGRRAGAGRFAPFLIAVALTALASGAEAAAKRKVGVSITGMPAGPIREAISDVLKKHAFETTTPDLSSDAEDAIASAARQSKLSAVIVGEVREGGKRVKLRVYGATGDLIGEGSWAEKGGPKKLAAAVERTLWARIGGSLSKAHPASGGGGEKAERAEKAPPPPAREEEEEKPSPSKPEEAPTYSRSKEPEAEPAASDEGEAPKKKAGKNKKDKKHAREEDAESGPMSPAAGPALDIEIGPRFVSRSLTWKETPVAANPAALDPYSLGLAPAFGASLAWFPAAHATGGFVSNLGIAASAEIVPGLVSTKSGGLKFPTSASDYWGGVRARIGFGPVVGALTAGGGQQAVIFHSQGASNRASLTGTPDVKYTYVRAGLDLRIALPSNLSVTLGGAYRYVLGAGNTNYLLETAMFLPNAKEAGFDANVGVGYRLLSMLEARAGFDVRRYAITAGTNGRMVSSGIDQYLAVWVGVAVVLDGPTTAGKSADDEDGEEPAPKPAKKKVEKSEDDESQE